MCYVKGLASGSSLVSRTLLFIVIYSRCFCTNFEGNLRTPVVGRIASSINSSSEPSRQSKGIKFDGRRPTYCDINNMYHIQVSIITNRNKFSQNFYWFYIIFFLIS